MRRLPRCQVTVYRNFLTFLAKALARQQNSDTWECGKGVLSANVYFFRQPLLDNPSGCKSRYGLRPAYDDAMVEKYVERRGATFPGIWGHFGSI
jgi:hypothetical protein